MGGDLWHHQPAWLILLRIGKSGNQAVLIPFTQFGDLQLACFVSENGDGQEVGTCRPDKQFLMALLHKNITNSVEKQNIVLFDVEKKTCTI
jgi:hypothetical protein